VLAGLAEGALAALFALLVFCTETGGTAVGFSGKYNGPFWPQAVSDDMMSNVAIQSGAK